MERMQVKVRGGMTMPLEKGGVAEGGETVSVSAEYYPKVSYFCESIEDSNESEKPDDTDDSEETEKPDDTKTAAKRSARRK